MRVMVIGKASKDSEAGVMPKQKGLEDMGKYNEELVKAGVMLAFGGLQPSSKGKIRPVFEAEDFGAELTPEMKERGQRLRAQIDAKKQ
jgi:YCII-related domain